MANKGQKVLLLLDNVSSHFPDIELRSVRLHYLPPNTTSHLQPLDAGIIKTFKSWYRRFQVEHLIHKLENDMTPDVNLKEFAFSHRPGILLLQRLLPIAGSILVL